ncbi:MAG: NADP-dependent malic enzyme [Pseudomonadota bacterium]|nr:NADP-dependent malic enzyme [Pseudomonadota bacterium]
MPEDFSEASLRYHRREPAGKLSIVATKPLANQRDLALAYSPGVAAACEEIVRDANEAASVTSRGNLVAVVSNGTAVLGLGDIGPLAAKPVMEGKAVLFKKFAGVDVFDIEVDAADPERLIEVVAALEPTFGGINLEDIKAPECFYVERALRERMNVPVFHDDQHGTAIIVAAAVRNALQLVDKQISEVKLAASGAGAAALACLDLLVSMGLRKENVTVVDRQGVIYEGREQVDEFKQAYARETDLRTLEEAMSGADIFLGLSGPGVLTPGMVKSMADQPLILALANPVPEIMPEEAKAARPDAIIATGRSDYPNQVNNVLCFPYIFRGALDAGATTINEEMKIACVDAIAELARAAPSSEVDRAYGEVGGGFGPDKVIPRPFDPRLIIRLAPAVARAAMESGVATRPIEDFEAYELQLSQFVFRSGFLMKPIFERACCDNKRLVLAEGEGYRTLQATQQLVDESLAKPVLIGRPEVIAERIASLGLHMEIGNDIEVVDLLHNAYYDNLRDNLHQLLGRRGISPAQAKHVVRTKPTVVAALMVKLGFADAMICGTIGPFRPHLKHVVNVIGTAPGASVLAALTALILPSGTFFLCDTHINPAPTAEEIAEMTLLAAAKVRQFGVEPRIALLSHANFGTNDAPAALKMRQAVALVHAQDRELEVEGEMHADAALSAEIRERVFPGSVLKGNANTFIMPDVGAGHISYNLLKMLGGGISIGPMLLGADKPAHVMTNSATVRAIVNMGALAVVDAQLAEQARDG